MKILVVDDSVVFRTQISSALKGVEGVEVVGSAANGKIALQKLEQLSVDLMTLDMEMPELDGIGTLKAMKEKGLNTKVIVFSSQTVKGAEKALEALQAGANDVVLKPSGDHLNFDTAQENIRLSLVPKVRQFMLVPGVRPLERPVRTTTLPEVKKKRSLNGFLPEAIVIASSTGGPTALETIFERLKGCFRIPVFIVQHMPPVFTQILAKRLSQISGMNVKEAQQNEIAKAGTIYIAPGDWHMRLEKSEGSIVIRLDQGPQRNSVRPAADYLFETASSIFRNNLFGIVLTGMGEDGAAGARAIQNEGGIVGIQDKKSCVVFGMPGAVHANDNYDVMGDLEFIVDCLYKVAL